MRQAATFGGAIAAGFVGFYLGLWALLAVMGLDGQATWLSRPPPPAFRDSSPERLQP